VTEKVKYYDNVTILACQACHTEVKKSASMESNGFEVLCFIANRQELRNEKGWGGLLVMLGGISFNKS